MRGLLIALALGTAAYLLTRGVIVGLLVGAAGLWLFRQVGPPPRYRRTEYSAPGRNLDSPRHNGEHNTREGEGIAVICKQVTAERQEWVSVKTGRLFDVLSPDGPPGARPGDSGEVFIQGTRYLVKTPVKP